MTNQAPAGGEMSETEEHLPTAERLRELLVGKKVTEARMAEDGPKGPGYPSGPTGYLTLSDGSTLKVWGNDGGCACDAGDYPLTELNAVDNIITNVEVEESPDETYTDAGGHYRIFVFAENQRIQLASFDGSDGNGYYGTGYWIEVEHP